MSVCQCVCVCVCVRVIEFVGAFWIAFVRVYVLDFLGMCVSCVHVCTCEDCGPVFVFVCFRVYMCMCVRVCARVYVYGFCALVYIYVYMYECT